MLSSILATFDQTKYFHVRTVLHELKKDRNINVIRIIYGQLFEKMTACIFVTECELEKVLEKLLTHDIQVFPYNDDFRQKITKALSKVKLTPEYARNKAKNYNENLSNIASNNHRKKEIRKPESPTALISAKSIDAIKNPISLKNNFEAKSRLSTSNHADIKKTDSSTLNRLCEEGDYIAIRNILKKNPIANQYAKEKYIPAIKNCIEIFHKKGLQNRSSVDQAISKLKDIVSDKEIKLIMSADLTNLAGSALINVAAEQDPEELVTIANLTHVGERVNVMAATRLSELIFENKKIGEVDNELLKYTAERINVRFVLLSFDVMETVISDKNKERFNKLINSINEIKM